MHPQQPTHEGEPIHLSHSGINLNNIDPNVRPQDDLYDHVNGAWLEAEVIPDDRALTGSFVTLRDDLRGRGEGHH